MKKKMVIVSISIAIIAIASIFLYSTYATDPVPSNDSYAITLTGDTTVTVGRYDYKDVIYQIKNTTDGTVNYGVGYSTSEGTATVKIFTDSTDPASGTMNINDYKYVKLRIENYSENSDTVTLSTILGYENGGNLIVPTGTTLVSSTTDGTYTMYSSFDGSTTYFYTHSFTRENIESIEYTTLSNMPVNATTTNISLDNSVRLWYELNEDTNLYKVYIGSLTGKFKAPSNMQGMFRNLTNVTNITNLSMIDTSNTTNMNFLFSGCSNVEELDVSNLNTSKVTTMGDMFCNCSKITELDLSNFDTSNVTTMQSMFDGCRNLTTLDLSSFETPMQINIVRMFYQCYKLKKVDMRKFNFNGIVGNNANTFNGPTSDIEIIVKDCEQYNLFKTKVGNKTGLRTVNNDTCS